MKILFAAVFLFAFLLAILVSINPGLIGGEASVQFNRELARKTDLPVFQTAVVPVTMISEAFFIYRGNIHRTGVAETTRSFQKMELGFNGHPLNFGIHTASKSSVAVDGDGYYVGTDEGLFYAFDFQNETKWSVKFISSVRGIHGTAATDGLYVYIGAYQGHLLCIRKSDGKIIWDVKVADAVGTSVLLDGPSLYITGEYSGKGALVAKLSKTTGQKVWTSRVFNDQSHSSPVLSEDGRAVLVGDNEGSLWSFDTRSGELLWREKLGGAIKGTPLVAGESVYVGSWGKDFCSFKALSGERNWCRNLEGLVQSSAALDPRTGDLFVQTSSTNSLLRLRSTDGRVMWKKKYNIGTRGGISSPLILWSSRAQSQLLALCEKKLLCLLDVVNGEVLEKIEIPGLFSGAPSFHKDEIFLSLDSGGIVRIHLR